MYFQAENFELPRVEVGDRRAQYTSIPFSSEPIMIPANSARAFCIHTDKRFGLAVRRKLNFDSNDLVDPYYREWTDGVTDEVSWRCFLSLNIYLLFCVSNVCFL